MKKALLGLLVLAILVVGIFLVFCFTIPELQRVTKTSKEQAAEIEALFAENNIVWQKIEWSYMNEVLSNEGNYEYYDVFTNDKKYTLELKMPAKQVYCIWNQTDETLVYMDENLGPQNTQGIQLLPPSKQNKGTLPPS